MFTDIEGSTRRWQDEPESMQALLVDHDAIFRDVIDKHKGLVFRHTVDGVAAVFASAGDAVNAAFDAQERLHGVLPVRMGLHTGEAELRDGGYLGATLHRCARLMSIGHGGQIVCSESTASLVRERDDLRDLGEHRLPDLSRASGCGRSAAARSRRYGLILCRADHPAPTHHPIPRAQSGGPAIQRLATRHRL
ncbi:MAG: adenylate/guanylate cyclase domain-containing protein [Acidimicrobiales bacterium]